MPARATRSRAGVLTNWHRYAPACPYDQSSATANKMLVLRACSAAGSVDENASSSAASGVPDARMAGCKQRVRFGASGIVEGRFSYSCEKGGQTGGQKATLVGRI